MRRSKRILLGAGLLLGFMFTGSIINMTTMTTYAAELTQSARWVGSGDRWQVSDNAGGYLKNQWFQDDVTGHWYLLGAEDGSVMYSGLVTDQSTGKSYLLNTNHDGTFGRMLDVDGVYNINGVDVYLTFDQANNGTHGAILTGLDSLRSTGVYEKQYDQIPIAQPETQIPTENPTTPSNDGTQGGFISEDLLNKYFGGKDGELTTSGDHPLSNGNSAFASDEEIEDAFGGRGSSGTTGSKVKLHG